MSTPLEELRAQRALIQQHLNWLDQQIQQAEGDKTPDSSVETPTPQAPEELPRPTDSLAEATVAPLQELKPTVEVEHDFDKLAQASSGSDLMKAKIGCLAFFIILTLLFLFLLFGLPYLID